jgi:hypothetical protein
MVLVDDCGLIMKLRGMMLELFPKGLRARVLFFPLPNPYFSLSI